MTSYNIFSVACAIACAIFAAGFIEVETNPLQPLTPEAVETLRETEPSVYKKAISLAGRNEPLTGVVVKVARDQLPKKTVAKE
jgi:hypothetical protein